jgi:hypothetical protein
MRKSSSTVLANSINSVFTIILLTSTPMPMNMTTMEIVSTIKREFCKRSSSRNQRLNTYRPEKSPPTRIAVIPMANDNAISGMASPNNHLKNRKMITVKPVHTKMLCLLLI